jgi:hypothetical protein
MPIFRTNPLAGFEKYHLQGRDAAIQGMDAATAGGLAFLTSSLEKQDPRLRQPLTSVTYPRDMPINPGGGYVDFTSNFFANYASTGSDELGIIASQTSKAAIVQADVTKDIFRVYLWENILRIPAYDLKKLQNAPFSLQQLLDSGLRLNYNKALDRICYVGVGAVPGLINNTTVTKTVAGAVWQGAAPEVIREQLDAVVNACWAAGNYDLNSIPNWILVPPAKFTLLNQVMVIGASGGGSMSLLNYYMQNNAAKAQGVDITILPSRWCIGAGVGGTDRLVAYHKGGEASSVEMDLPVPLNRGLSAPSLESGAVFNTSYNAMIGQVKVLYPQSISYTDGV